MKYFTTLLAVGLVSLAVNPVAIPNGDDDDARASYFYRSPIKKSHFANSETDSEYEHRSPSESDDEDAEGTSNELGASSSKRKKRTSKKREGGMRKGTTPGCRCGIDCPTCTIPSPHPSVCSNGGGSDAGQETFEEWSDLGFDSDLIDTKEGPDSDDEDPDIALEDARTAVHMIHDTANAKDEGSPDPSGPEPSVSGASLIPNTSGSANGTAVAKPVEQAGVDDKSKEKDGKVQQTGAAMEAADKPDSKTNPGTNSTTSITSDQAAVPTHPSVPKPAAQPAGANIASPSSANPAPSKAIKSLWSRKGKTAGPGQVDTTLNPQGTNSNTSTPVSAAGQPPSAGTSGNIPSPASAAVGKGTRSGSAVETGDASLSATAPAFTQEREDIREDEGGGSGSVGKDHEKDNAETKEEEKIDVKTDDKVQGMPSEPGMEPVPQSQSQNQDPQHIQEVGDTAIPDALSQPPKEGGLSKQHEPGVKRKGKARAPTPTLEPEAEVGLVTAVDEGAEVGPARAGEEEVEVPVGGDNKGKGKARTAKGRTLWQNWASSRPRYTLQQKLVPGGLEAFDEEIEPCPCCGR